MSDKVECCDDNECCCPAGVSRRNVVRLAVAGATAGLLASRAEAANALGIPEEDLLLIPADKGQTEASIAALTDRGVPTRYTGTDLRYIGMPVGGACCGQVYLGGDGQLWRWDIDNPPMIATGDGRYANPPAPSSPFRQGFAIRTTSGSTVVTRRLNSEGFSQIRFTGQYPIGTVVYQDPAVPVEVTLQAFSPFVPPDVADSTIPLTVLDYTVRNTSAQTVTAQVLGWSENPVYLRSRRQQPTNLSAAAFSATGVRGLEFSGVPVQVPPRQPRPEIVFEDWEKTTYSGWTVTGQAFGTGPVTVTEVPEYMRRFGDLRVSGTRFVTSHHFRAAGVPDSHTGKLTSAQFTISRRYINVRVGGGNHAGQTCVNVVVDGRIIASATGANTEPMATRWLDVGDFEGRRAVIEIVDAHTGAWGHVNCDRIVFSDVPVDSPRAAIVFEDWEATTFGTWRVEGNAFGAGPLTADQLPADMRRFGSLNLSGSRLVTSFPAGGDGRTGKLTSAAFTVSRRYVSVRVGGGNHPGRTCVNVVVDGQVVASATGEANERLVTRLLDVAAYEGRSAVIEVVDAHTGAWGHVNCDRIVFCDVPAESAWPDVVFEDWERPNFGGWRVEGDAFGTGPVTLDQVPEDMRRFGEPRISGTRFVSSYPTGGDGRTGKLISNAFTIPRRYMTVRVGGGNHPGQTCVNVVVGGRVVASATGSNTEVMVSNMLDLQPWLGQSATIEIVDAHTGGWGHISIDRISFGDVGADLPPADQRGDNGTFALAAVADAAVVRPSLAAWGTVAEVFDAPAGPDTVDSARGQAGTVSTTVTLAAGQSRTVRFLIGWYFPVPDRVRLNFLTEAATLRRHYATRFTSAQDVVRKTTPDLTRLANETRRWTQTWYADSTLPHWLLERTLIPASTLATNTCFLFSNGRFYGWEGVYCCAGTCEHVWNYAQSVARLFPALERDTRERVDLGIAMHPSGEMGNRAEAEPHFYADGQCGTILRIYREHQCSPDASFLTRVWPKVKQALSYVMTRDGATADGVLFGPQPNTLDQTWYGEIAWITGVYVAALRAGAAMATEVGDTAFASRCTMLAESGTRFLESTLWTGQFFIQRIDPAHAGAINTNRGCHIDQLLGQALAAQLGLPRVFAKDKSVTALGNIYRFNFSPDPARYRVDHPQIPGGRWFAVAGEPGLIMTTWPNGGAETAAGNGPSWAAAYFNEVWSGQEYAVAGQMIADGLLNEGLTITRAVHDRYHARKRNPYNEIECGDHYARAMSSHGVYNAMCGFEYHGPAGHIGFAPRLTPQAFSAAFTAAQGWGLYRQARSGNSQTSVLDIRHGQVRVRTIALETPARPASVTVTVGGVAVAISGWTYTSGRLLVTLAQAQTIATNGQMTIVA